MAKKKKVINWEAWLPSAAVLDRYQKVVHTAVDGGYREHQYTGKRKNRKSQKTR